MTAAISAGSAPSAARRRTSCFRADSGFWPPPHVDTARCGSMTLSPAATWRIVVASCSGGASLSRYPPTWAASARRSVPGDRGMITSARIKDLQELEGMAWITCLRHPAIKKLMAGDGPLQLSLFDEQDLAEISSPDFPGERLIACRNPFEAAKRARTRQELLAATEADLGAIAARAAAGRLKDPDKIGVAAGKVINKRKVARHFILDISEGRISWRRDQDSIDAEAATDGIYVIRTPVPAGTLDAAGAVAAYKDLANLERDFRHIKAEDLDLRPIYHRLEDRVRGHVLICMLACYLTWHLRQAWAPPTYPDEHPPARANPVAPARRSPSADAKAAVKTGPGKQPI